MTARTNVDKSNKGWEIVDGFFFLQRASTKRYLARFKVEADNISHHREEEDFDHEGEEINRDGRNLSAIELTDMKMKEGDQMPELPEFKVYNEGEFDDDTIFTLSGYP